MSLDTRLVTFIDIDTTSQLMDQQQHSWRSKAYEIKVSLIDWLYIEIGWCIGIYMGFEIGKDRQTIVGQQNYWSIGVKVS